MPATPAVQISPAQVGLTFDAERHAYALHGRRVLSVTQVLRLSGHVDPRWFTDFARLRGTYVHQAIELDCRGELDEAALHESLVPYVEAYRTWRAYRGFVLHHVEYRMGSEVLQLAGTADQIGEADSHLSIVDVKSGAVEPYHRLQLALYATLYGDAHQVPRTRIRRAGLYLTADGRFKEEPYADRADFAAADAARVNAQWRLIHDARAWRELDKEGSLNDGRSLD